MTIQLYKTNRGDAFSMRRIGTSIAFQKMTAILIKKQQTAEKERIIAEGRGERETWGEEGDCI